MDEDGLKSLKCMKDTLPATITVALLLYFARITKALIGKKGDIIMELTFWLAHPCLVFFVCFMSAMAIFVGFCGVCYFGSQILESITGKKLEDMLPFLKE